MEPVKLIGIDPGLANFAIAVAHLTEDGWPVFERIDVWRTQPSKELKRGLRKMDDTAERCRFIALSLNDCLLEHRPVAICIEAIALPFGKIQSSVVSALGRVRGLVDMAAEIHHLAVLEEGPIRLKKLTTGNAKATKAEVQASLESRYPELKKLWPTQTTLHEHAADAAGLIHICRQAPEVLAVLRHATRAAS